MRKERQKANGEVQVANCFSPHLKFAVCDLAFEIALFISVFAPPKLY